MTHSCDVEDRRVDALVDVVMQRIREAERRPPSENGSQRALEALAAIQNTFQESGITEQELQEEGRRIRQQVSRQRYPRQFSEEGPVR